MNYIEYTQLSQQISAFVEQGKYRQAIKGLEKLFVSDISDLDKALQCLNMAVVHEQQAEMEKALEWYDRGIMYEKPYSRFYVTEQKAVYLARKGRIDESLRIYEGLLEKPYLTEGDKERVRKNVQELRTR